MRDSGVALLWGPPRSGTTWLFNVVRDLLAEADLKHEAWVFGHEPPRLGDRHALIVKSHQAHSLEAIRACGRPDRVHVVSILRDPHQAFQSLVRTQDASREEVLAWLRRDILSLDAAFPELPHAVVLREEWIADRGASVVTALARHLRIPVDAQVCAEIARRFSRDEVRATVNAFDRERGWSGQFAHYDPHTHWHGGHIAPDDHVPVEPTPAEGVELLRLRVVVERLTQTYSITHHRDSRALADPDDGVSHTFLRHAAPRRRLLSRLPLRKAS